MFNKLAPQKITSPTAEIISLGDAKKHLRRDDSDDDDYISTLISVVESNLDGSTGILGRMLIEQVWQETANMFPSDDCFELLLKPVSAINAIQYYDDDNIIQTLPDTNYNFHNGALNDYIKLNKGFSWPSTYQRDDAVVVEYTGGYGDNAASVPKAIIQAAKLLIGHYYENRESVVVGTIATELPMAVKALLAPYTRSRF